MDLSIIVVNFNTKKLLQDCLESIFQQTRGIKFEVIVVDNASKDGSAAMVKKAFPQAVLIQNKQNRGFAQANNQGIRKAKGEYLLLLNSDTKVINNALKKLVDFARTKPDLGVVGPRLLNRDGSHQPSTAPFLTLPVALVWLVTGDRLIYSSPQKTRQADWVMGSALMVKNQALKKAGLLDEKFFMYVEEVEWCYRIKKAGWQVWFYPGAKIFHLVRGSSPEGKQRAVLGIYQNLLYFYRKHFAPWQLTVLKFFLRTKAKGAWLVGLLTENNYLKQTYAKAFKLARQ